MIQRKVGDHTGCPLLQRTTEASPCGEPWGMVQTHALEWSHLRGAETWELYIAVPYSHWSKVLILWPSGLLHVGSEDFWEKISPESRDTDTSIWMSLECKHSWWGLVSEAYGVQWDVYSISTSNLAFWVWKWHHRATLLSLLWKMRMQLLIRCWWNSTPARWRQSD